MQENTPDKDPIIAYLGYLRDVSRKIGRQSGFARVLVQETKTRPNFALQTADGLNRIGPKSEQYAHFKNVLAWLDKNSDKRLFLGYGLFAGVKDNKTYAAPLILQEIWLEREDFSRQLLLSPDYASTSLNYDLLAGVSGRVNIAEDEAFDEAFNNEVEFVEAAENIFRETLFGEENRIERMRSYARKNWADNLEDIPESQRPYEFMRKLARELQETLTSALPEFADIEDAPGAYNFAQEKAVYAQRRKKSRHIKSVFEGPLAFADAAHFFVARIPDELSVFHALENLREEARRRGFRNPLLAKLLKSALKSESLKINRIPQPRLRAVVENELAMPLSENQQAALENAFENELSYIQGPPGTGKSHTITALLACAAAMNKNVLVVSQKEAALRVVQDKLSPLLAGKTATAPLVYYDKNARGAIRGYTKQLLEASQNPGLLREATDRLEARREKLRKELGATLRQEQKLRRSLLDFLEKDGEFCRLNEAFFEKKENLREKYQAPAPFPPAALEPPASRTKNLTRNMRNMAAQSPTLLSRMYDAKFRRELQDKLGADSEVLEEYGLDYAEDLIDYHLKYTAALRQRERIPGNSRLVRYELEEIQTRKTALQTGFARVNFELGRLRFLAEDEYRDTLNRLDKLLYWRNPSIIAERRKKIDFAKLLEILPFWAFELRDIGNILPMTPQLFDLVVVDEASQVNLAEILPAFYRGANICVVGDHKQLGIDSTGVNFQLSKKYDALTWTRHNAAGLTYNEAKARELTVTDASLLDFLRSKNHGVILPQKMLDEHFRSLPALASYTAEFYREEEKQLKIMTELPDNIFRAAFLELEVEGKRAPDKTAPEEAALLIQLMEELTSGNLGRLKELAVYSDGPPLSVGIISMMRSQVYYLQEKLAEAFPETVLEKHDVMVGTPEEFQGNERDVVFFSLCLDETCVRSAAHYQNAPRLNVATSRARLFTIALHAGIPRNMKLLDRWLRHFRRFEAAEIARGWSPADARESIRRQPRQEIPQSIRARTRGKSGTLRAGAKLRPAGYSLRLLQPGQPAGRGDRFGRRVGREAIQRRRRGLSRPRARLETRRLAGLVLSLLFAVRGRRPARPGNAGCRPLSRKTPRRP